MDSSKLKDILPAIASKYQFRLGVLEKDYYLTVVLNEVYQHLSDKLVFKGGTLLNKIYLDYHRLSEDLDFTLYAPDEIATRSQRSKAIEPIRKKMPEFLKLVGLQSDEPRGTGFNESTEYIFLLNYHSFVTNSTQSIKLEIGLRQQPIEATIMNTIKHVYQDPFTNNNLLPMGTIPTLSYIEAVAEKMKAAINREKVAIRDYYDLWVLYQKGFKFNDKNFITLLNKKLSAENYLGNFHNSFGLSEDKIALLRQQINTDLMPVLRITEKFNLDEVFSVFNKLMKSW